MPRRRHHFPVSYAKESLPCFIPAAGGLLILTGKRGELPLDGLSRRQTEDAAPQGSLNGTAPACVCLLADRVGVGSHTFAPLNKNSCPKKSLTSAKIHGSILVRKTGRCPKPYRNKKGCTSPIGWVTPISFCEQMIKRKTKAQSSKALQKGLDVLRKFAYEKEDWGPREIARSLDISKSSALRVLQTLKNQHFLSPAKTDGKYCIGPNFGVWVPF